MFFNQFGIRLGVSAGIDTSSNLGEVDDVSRFFTGETRKFPTSKG